MKAVGKIVAGVVLLFLLMGIEAGIKEQKQETLDEWKASISVEREEDEERLTRVPPIPEVVPVRETVELPSFYDYREEGRATQVKNQEKFNNCWAFAGTTALESALMPEEQAVFSTDHMTNCNSYAFDIEAGGAYVMAVAYLTAWQGPVYEDEDPSGDGESPEGLSAVKQVLDVRILDYKDYNGIKQAVLLYGGVESSIYMDFEAEDGSSDSYDRKTFGYCYQGETEPNHDVVIIGWDDAYPAENFKVPPEGDGAFICQNSWGSQFGDKGIFYVSYYDSNIGGSTTAYTRVEEAGYFDGLYQSDLCGWTGQIGYNMEEAWFANVYTARETERLAGAGFYTTGPESTYEVYLAPEFTDGVSLNKRTFLTNGYLQYAGYHTIEFPEEISLEKGQRFALIVHITTEDASYPIAVEYAQDGEYGEFVKLEDGEGYISDRGSLWSDTEKDCGSNVCLKAYVNRS